MINSAAMVSDFFKELNGSVKEQKAKAAGRD
ncbi:hypothetical protein DYBT9275_00997 [Dyadobacter sp. CECT 9275]|uniref:Uncharacterized protein n=1 Tax=Dyadobacter helix TaxID=2822344 RepID=A0A916N304_9BACT|nr:hypothetical protein DYBT9275_00997 [Dyadobacter sp. CECT 9275]